MLDTEYSWIIIFCHLICFLTYTTGEETVVALFITSNRHVNKLWTEDLETEKVDMVCKMKESTSAVYWRDKREVCLLISMGFKDSNHWPAKGCS